MHHSDPLQEASCGDYSKFRLRQNAGEPLLSWHRLGSALALQAEAEADADADADAVLEVELELEVDAVLHWNCGLGPPGGTPGG